MSKRSYRSKHRMRSHEAAHAAETSGGDAGPILEHPLVPRNDPEIVASRAGLLALIERLRGGGKEGRGQKSEVRSQQAADDESLTSDPLTSPTSFAYDSEFIGEETYHPRLCVIQVATAEFVALIDALALEQRDLSPFWELLAYPAVEKIVHAGQQDLEPVVRHLDRPPANIFDVQVAAGFIGLPYPASLSRLIAEIIGPEAAGCVGAKFSQWDQRPLSPVQMQYAANDVRYLPLLRREMGRRLDEAGNADRARREFEELCDPSLYRFDALAQRLRVRGAERLGPAQKAALRALLGWRDRAARKSDVPPRTLVADGVIYEIARELIQCPRELRAVRGLPKPIKRSSTDLLLQLVRDAIDECGKAADEADPDASPRRRVDFDRERAQVDALWHAMRERAHAHSIDPALVTSKRELAAYVRSRNAGSALPAAEQRLTRPGGWRRDLLADLLQAQFGKGD